MVSQSSFAGQVPGGEGLRTRFNMGFGLGLRLVAPNGFALRSHWVYNIFAPYPASRLTWGDLGAELAWPLVFRKRREP
jgi:hypothetical protein